MSSGILFPTQMELLTITLCSKSLVRTCQKGISPCIFWGLIGKKKEELKNVGGWSISNWHIFIWNKDNFFIKGSVVHTDMERTTLWLRNPPVFSGETPASACCSSVLILMGWFLVSCLDHFGTDKNPLKNVTLHQSVSWDFTVIISMAALTCHNWQRHKR